MKNIFLAILFFPLMALAQKKGNFILKGSISGKVDGMKVYLKSQAASATPVDDSAIIKNGQFTFKGHLNAPVMCQLIIDRTPKGKVSDAKSWSASNFYLENSTITYAGDINTLPAFYWKKDAVSKPPTIKGSATQDEFVKFNAGVADLKKELRKTDDEYLKVYHIPAMEGKFNTKEGIDLARKYNYLDESILNYTLDYIHAHPASVISYDQATYMLAGYTTTLTIPQIDDLVKTIGTKWKGTSSMKTFLATSEAAKRTAIGIKYQDFEFQTPDGKKVMLSNFVPTGKVVMLEFWASWCGPCRAEIPHLKYLNDTKSDQFSIVSISLDESNTAWQKAMKDEGMVWTQLCDSKGFEGEIAQAYNIVGIPQSLVLDKEGRIMKVGLRGAFLDAYLEDIK